MKTLFFADTPLQLYNSFLLASSGELGNASVLIYSQFNNAETLAEAYDRMHIFEQIIILDPINTKSYIQTFFWQLQATAGWHRLNLSELKNTYFDSFCLACPTPATMEVLRLLKRKNNDLTTYFYEDGTGTYNGNVFKQPFYFERPPAPELKSVNYINAIRKISSLQKKVKYHYKPKTIFVKRPNLMLFNPNIPCKKILIKKNKVNELEALLSSPMPKLDEVRFLIFDVPRSKTEGFGANAIDAIISRCIKSSSGENHSSKTCYLRNHPRSTERSPFASSCIDFSEGLWELTCQNNDLSNCLLISIGSTAQLAPYIESGKQPPLMLLYKIAFQENDQHYQLAEQVLNLIKHAYEKKYSDLIYIPTTIEEALKIIDSFKKI